MNNPKEFILSALTVISGILNAYFWKQALLAGSLSGVAFYSVPVASLFLFAILFSLASLFIRDGRLRAFTVILSLAGGYLFLPYSSGVLLAGVVSGILAWFGAREIQREEKAASTFRVRKFLGSGLPLFFTALSLLLAVFFYSANSDPNQPLVPKKMFDIALPFVESSVQGVLPGFRTNASMDDVLLAFAKRTIGASFDISKLSAAEKNQLFSEGRIQLKNQFGVAVQGNEKASDVLYKITNAQIQKILGPYKAYMPLIAAIGFFIAAKALTFPVYIITLLLVFGVIQSLKAVGVLKMETTTISVERLRL